MFNFSSLFKQKKTLIFFFLIAIIFTAIPNLTLAIPVGCDKETAAGTGWCNTANNQKIVEAPGFNATPASFATIVKKCEFLTDGCISVLISGFGMLVVNVEYKIAAIVQIVLSWAIGALLSKSITTSDIFVPIWVSVRNLGNMLLVLGFVVVGIATALRIQSYAAKQLLWKLILVALFINFSGLACGLIIDASNMVTGGLIEGGGSIGFMPYNILNTIWYVTNHLLKENLAITEPVNFAIMCLELGAVYVAIAYTFIYLFIILVARYAVLVILYILSPLAFAFWVFPASKKLWTDWWNHFIKWSFIGVFGSFTLWISTKILVEQPMIKESDFLSGSGTTYILYNVSISCILVIIFLIVGFKMTASKTGVAAMATTAVMGVASGGAMLMAGGKALSKAGGVTGAAQRVGQKMGDGVTAAGERFGFVNKGTLASRKNERLKEPTSRLDAITDNKELAKIATQTPMTAQKAAEKAAAVHLLAKRNALGAIDPTKRGQSIAYAQSFGGTKDQMDALAKGAPSANATATTAEATAKVMQGKVDNLMKRNPGMTQQQARNQLQYATHTPNEISQAQREIRQQRITENSLGITTPVTDDDAKASLIDKRQEALSATGMSSAEVKKRVAAYSKNISSGDIATRRGELGEERIQKAVKKMAVASVPEIVTEAIPTFAKHAGSNQMASMLRNGTDEKVQAFKDAVKAYGQELRTAMAAGDADATKKFAERQKAIKEAVAKSRNKTP